MTVSFTPESVLVDGLRRRGHDVTASGHRVRETLRGFDVVHAHHLGLGAVQAATSSDRAPMVFTRHGWSEKSPLRGAALRYVLSRADAIVALSDTEANMQRRKLGVAFARQHVIANGIDRALFPYAPPPATNRWRLLYVGQLIREKGVFNLLDAVAALRPEYEVEVRFVYHVGIELEALRATARKLGLTSVMFLGGMPAPQLVQEYSYCHALVLPSLSDALPSVVTEALMVGRPVVATDVGAVREQVGDFGIVVPPGDVGALAYGIRKVFDEYSRFVTSAETHSDLIAARYSVEPMVRGHEQLYGALAGASARRHRTAAVFGTYLGRHAIASYSRRVHQAVPR